MRLEQISYFLSVAEHGNITAAARSLYISQPALSKQITLLEQEIGLPLFERQARGCLLYTSFFTVAHVCKDARVQICDCLETTQKGERRTEKCRYFESGHQVEEQRSDSGTEQCDLNG